MKRDSKGLHDNGALRDPGSTFKKLKVRSKRKRLISLNNIFRPYKNMQAM